MNKLLEKLKGYKTFITGTVTIVSTVGAFLVGELELVNAIQLIVTSLLAMFVRDGMKTEAAKVVSK